MLYFNSMWNIFFSLSFYNLLLILSSVFTVHLLSKISLKTNFLNILTWIWFFGTITHTMMTAMIKNSEPHSESEDSDSPQPPPPNSQNPTPKSKSFTYQPNIKSKLFSLKIKISCIASLLHNLFLLPMFLPLIL